MQYSEQLFDQVQVDREAYIDNILNNMNEILEIKEQIDNEIEIVNNLESVLIQQEQCYLKSTGLMMQIQNRAQKQIQNIKYKSTTNLKLQEIMQTFDIPEKVLETLQQDHVNGAMTQAIEHIMPILNSDNFDNLRVKYEGTMKNDKVSRFFTIIFALSERLQDYIYQQDTQIFQRNNKLLIEFVIKVSPQMRENIQQLYEQYISLQNYNFCDDIEDLTSGYNFKLPYSPERSRGRQQDFSLFMPILTDVIIQQQFLFFKKIQTQQSMPFSFEKEIRANIDSNQLLGLSRQDLKYDDIIQVYVNQLFFQYNFNHREQFERFNNMTIFELYNDIQKQKYHTIKQGVKITQVHYNNVYYPEHIIYYLLNQTRTHIIKQQKWQQECLPFEYNNYSYITEQLEKCIQKILQQCDIVSYINLYCILKEQLNICDIQDFLPLLDRLLSVVSHGILLSYYHIFGYLTNNPILDQLLETFEQKVSYFDGYLRQSKAFKQQDGKNKQNPLFDGSLIDPGSNSSAIIGTRASAFILTLQRLQNTSFSNIPTIFIQDLHKYLTDHINDILESVNVHNDEISKNIFITNLFSLINRLTQQNIYDVNDYLKNVPQTEYSRLYSWVQTKNSKKS